jgi:murein DD-endopeptidase MepM/ murein hydrolase activator NlpD
MFANLLQASNELAQGRMPDSNALLMSLVESRQMAQQPSVESENLASTVRKPAKYGPAVGGRGITYSGEKLTHNTDGLEGYPAIDQFAKPGTPFEAPENGRVVRHSGHGGTSGQVYGYSVYFKGDSGKEYFITHLAPQRARLNSRLRKGQVIGRVSPWSGGAPHAHVGING